MRRDDLGNISFSTIKAYFQVTGPNPVRLPRYAGSTFRGALGHAMRLVRFGMHSKCDHCRARSACRYSHLYEYLFETPSDHPYITENASILERNVSHFSQPFILDPPQGGQYLPEELMTVSITMVGRAIEFLPFFVCSLEKMGDGHLGAQSGRARLVSIVNGRGGEDADEDIIYDAGSGKLIGPVEIMDFHHIQNWISSFRLSEDNDLKLHIFFLTPFRFKHLNRLGKKLTFPILMKNIFRRLTLLSVHGLLDSEIDYHSMLKASESVRVEYSGLKWVDWMRYSNRQKTRMAHGGLIGEIVFSGPLGPFLTYIKIAEFLNIGKNCTFGLGKFRAMIEDGD